MTYLTSVGTRTEAEVLIAKLATFGISSYRATDVTHTFEPITPVDVYVESNRVDEARGVVEAVPLTLAADYDEYTGVLQRRKRRVGMAMFVVLVVAPVAGSLLTALLETN